MKIKAIIFDLDGTLLNTLSDLTAAVNYSLSKRGYETHTIEAVRGFIGEGVRHLIACALPAAHKDETDAALADFRAYYDAHLTDFTAPYEGMPALIADLRARKLALAVLSNKYDAAVKKLAQHSFGDAFAPVLGERAGVPRKPNPAAVQEILATLHIAPQETLYVGDSGVDMQTAKNAGVFAVGATWGFCARETLLQNGANALIDTPQELLTLL